MVRPIGFGSSVPLMAPAGAPAAAAPAPAAAGAAAPAPAASTPVTVPQAFRMVQDLWVAIKVTRMEGPAKGRATDEQFEHWYYPILGAALAADYIVPASGYQAYKNALKGLKVAATASQLQIAFEKVNALATRPMSGDDIVRVARKLDQDELLKESIKVCLGNIRSVVDYKKGVDVNYYETAFDKMLTSDFRGGASLHVVRQARMKALQDIDAMVKSGTSPAVAVNRVAGQLAMDPRFKLFSPAAPAAGAGASSGALAGYPPKAVDLAKELVRAKARQDGEVLSDAQVDEKALELLGTYKGYMGHPPTMIKAMEEDLEIAKGKEASGPGFTLDMNYNKSSAKGFAGTTALSGAIDPNKFKYSLGGSKASVVLRKFNFTYNSGKAEAQGLNATDAFTGPLWTLQNNDAANGEAAVGLSYDMSGHVFTIGYGYRTPLNAEKMGDGKSNSFAAYQTPSLGGLSAAGELLFEAATPGKDDGSQAATLEVKYAKPNEKPEEKKSVVVVTAANLKGEFKNKKGVMSSKVIAGAAVKLGDITTVGLKCTYVDPGKSPHKDCVVTGAVQVSDPLSIELEGAAVLDEGTVSYGMPNAGVAVNGEPVPPQPSEHTSSTKLSLIAKFVVSLNKFVDVFVGGGVATYNTSVEGRSRGQLENVFTVGAKVKGGR